MISGNSHVPSRRFSTAWAWAISLPNFSFITLPKLFNFSWTSIDFHKLSQLHKSIWSSLWWWITQDEVAWLLKRLREFNKINKFIKITQWRTNWQGNATIGFGSGKKGMRPSELEWFWLIGRFSGKHGAVSVGSPSHSKAEGAGQCRNLNFLPQEHDGSHFVHAPHSSHWLGAEEKNYHKLVKQKTLHHLLSSIHMTLNMTHVPWETPAWHFSSSTSGGGQHLSLVEQSCGRVRVFLHAPHSLHMGSTETERIINILFNILIRVLNTTQVTFGNERTNSP